MPSEMRRPPSIQLDVYVTALDATLRDQVGRTRRWVIPDAVRHPIHALKSLSRPLIQGGAMVLTALAVIIAVGAAPATVTTPSESELTLTAPSVSIDLVDDLVVFTDLLPTEDLLAVQKADILDTPTLTVE